MGCPNIRKFHIHNILMQNQCRGQILKKTLSRKKNLMIVDEFMGFGKVIGVLKCGKWVAWIVQIFRIKEPSIISALHLKFFFPFYYPFSLETQKNK